MAGRKEFELLFKLQATLGSGFNSSFNSAMNASRQLQGNLSKINTLSGKIEGFQKQSAALQANKDKLAQLTEEHDRLQREMSQTEQPSEALRQKMERNARQIEQTTARIEEQEARLGQLGSELSEAGINTDRLSQENDKLAKSYERIKKNQEHLANIAQAQQKNNEAIAQTKSRLNGTLRAFAAVGAAIYAGPVKSSMAFEKQMSNVGTLLDGDVAGRIAELKKSVISISNITGAGTDNLTDGLYQVISAFGDTAESAKLLEIASKAATAGGATTTDSINLLSAVTKGYGDISAEAQQKAADLAFQTVKLGQTSFPELASSVGKVIPLAATLSLKQEDLFGAMATLTGVTGSTAEVTTQLKATMQGFLSPSKDMTASLEKLGYANGKALLESKGLQGALDALRQSVGGDELAFAKLFSSVEAQTAVLALAGEQADNFKSKTAEMYSASGAAATAFATATDNAESKMQKAKNAIANLGIVLGDTFLPYVTTAAEKLSGLVTKFSAWAQENPKLLSTIVKVAAALLGLKAGGQAGKLAFLEIKGGILGIQGAFAKMKAFSGSGGIKSLFSGLGGIKGKLLPLVGIIGGVALAIKLISGNLEEVRGWIQQTFGDGALAVFDKVWGVIQNVGAAIKGVFSGEGMGNARNFFEEHFGEAGVAVFDSLIGVVEQLKGILPGLLDQFAQLATALLPVIGSLIQQIVPLIGEIIATVLPILLDLIAQLLPVIGQIVEAILPVLIQLVETLVPIVMQIIEAVLPILQQLLEALMPIIQQIIDNILPIVIDLIMTVVSAIQPLVEAILPVLQSLLQALMPIIQAVAELFSNVLGAAINAISGILNGLTQILQGLITFITGVFTGNWKQAWEGVKSIFSGIWEAIKSVCTGVVNGIISVINTVIGGLNKLKIPDWVPGIGGMGINIPLIPMLAKGSKYTPDTFIAGEAGAELVTNARGRTVFTAAQTGRIFDNINAAREAQDGTTVVTLLPLLQAALSAARVGPGGVSAPTVTAESPQGGGIVIHSAPVFHVGSEAQAEDIEELLDRRDEELLDKFDDRMKQREDDERRRRYD